MSRGMGRGGVPRQLLACACAEPLTLSELADRLAHQGVIAADGTVSMAARALRRRGLLAVVGQRAGSAHAKLYTLTPDGEALLREACP